MRYQFVDCRWELGAPTRGRELYLEGHIPGASFLDVDEDLSAPPGVHGRHPLPDSDEFAAKASRAGIGEGVFVVAYGLMGGAERLWWLLRHFGHDDCAVLDLDAWLGPLTSREEETEPAVFEPKSRSDDTIEADELLSRLGASEASRTPSTGSRAASRARSTPRGTSPSRCYPRASSWPTAAPASRRR